MAGITKEYICSVTSINKLKENFEARAVAMGGPNTNQHKKANKRSFNTTKMDFLFLGRLLRVLPIIFIVFLS
jgi:hypothetical protein